jgi:hypothetical protein
VRHSGRTHLRCVSSMIGEIYSNTNRQWVYVPVHWVAKQCAYITSLCLCQRLLLDILARSGDGTCNA